MSSLSCRRTANTVYAIQPPFTSLGSESSLNSFGPWSSSCCCCLKGFVQACLPFMSATTSAFHNHMLWLILYTWVCARLHSFQTGSAVKGVQFESLEYARKHGTQ